MAPPARTITVSLDMSKAFDTINIHTLIRKLLQKTFQAQPLSSSQTTSRDAKPTQHIEITHPSNVNLKLAFHKVASFHPHYLTFTPQTYHHPVQVMSYADGITITSTHRSTSAAKKYIQPYLHPVFAWTKQNNLLLNPDKTTCTLFTSDPAEYTSNLDLTINNKALPMATHPKVLGLTLDPKLTYSIHIHNISVQSHTPLQIITALTATGSGKQKETLMATYKAVMRPALEYASSVWSPIASSTSINKLQVMQNATLRTATGCRHDTNIQHMRDETLTLPIHEHLQLVERRTINRPLGSLKGKSRKTNLSVLGPRRFISY